MSIELTALPAIPADQVAAAFTLAAVPSPDGPVRYKAPLGTAAAGPAGPAGAKGDTGAAGAKGDTGAAGAAGAKGDPGSTAIATSATVGVVKPDGVLLQIAGDGSLTAPNIAPAKFYFATPSDGSALGSNVNAVIADTLNHGGSTLRLMPGKITADVPTAVPSRFHLMGIGPREPNSAQNPGGGVLIIAPSGSVTGCVTMKGVKNNPSTSDGFLFNPRLENVALSGSIYWGDVTRPGGPAKLLDIRNAYNVELEGVSGANDFNQFMYIENVWDSYFNRLRCNACGFSDPHATTDNATVQGYTGRSFTALETAIGRSLGVPMLEIYSPDTNGDDNSNNLRFDDGHFESNTTNGVPVMIRGNNSAMHTFRGWKIEATEGNVPMFVADGSLGLRLEAWIYGGGVGQSYVPYGGVVGGEQWKNDGPNPGLVLLGSYVSPKLDLTMGYATGGAALQAYIRCIGTSNPRVEASGFDGLSMLTPAGAAGMIFDNCGPVSAARTQAFPNPYVLAQAGGSWTERRLINGSTEVA